MWILRSPTTDDSKPLVFRIPPGRVRTVGRVGNADFVVEDALVSRIHCRLAASIDGELHVEDLDSTNGTYVNDQRVAHALLTPGDRVRFGPLELVVEQVAGEDAEVP